MSAPTPTRNAMTAAVLAELPYTVPLQDYDNEALDELAASLIAAVLDNMPQGIMAAGYMASWVHDASAGTEAHIAAAIAAAKREALGHE